MKKLKPPHKKSPDPQVYATITSQTLVYCRYSESPRSAVGLMSNCAELPSVSIQMTKQKPSVWKEQKLNFPEADPWFFLEGGAPLRNEITDRSGRQIKSEYKDSFISGGVRTPCTLPLGPPLTFHYQSRRRQWENYIHQIQTFTNRQARSKSSIWRIRNIVEDFYNIPNVTPLRWM